MFYVFDSTGSLKQTQGPFNLANAIGNLDVSHLNGGSGANAGSFWRGDGTWGAPVTSGLSTVVLTVTDVTGWSTTPKVILAGTANKVNIPLGLYMIGIKTGTNWTNGNNGFSLVYSNLTGNNLLASAPSLALANSGTVKGLAYQPATITNTSLSALAGIDLKLKTALDMSGGSGTTITFVMPYYQVSWTAF